MWSGHGGIVVGLDQIFPEFLNHARVKVKQWLLAVLNAIITRELFPKASEISTIVVFLKPKN